MKLEDILRLRASGHVQRCHTVPHVGSYSVAEHCAQALHLLFCLHPAPSINLVKAILWHDHAERECGDLPAPIKRKHPDLAEAYNQIELGFFQRWEEVYEPFESLSDYDRIWLRSIDTLELLLWAKDQILLGNRHAENIAYRAREYLNSGIPIEMSTFLAHLDVYEWRSFV